MARIAIDSAFRPIEVDLWGHEFETLDMTRAKSHEAARLTVQLGELGDEDEDRGVEILGKLLDLKLVATDAKRTKPSTLLKQRWQADELSLRQVFIFLGNLGRAEQEDVVGELEAFANGRPT